MIVPGYDPLRAYRNTPLVQVFTLANYDLSAADRAGNPIEVGAVVVWRVPDTARAAFDVHDYVTYVAIQSESALRAVASARWYDGDEQGRNSLRGDLDAVAAALGDTIQEHVALAGIEIIQARIADLAYAPEIASAMLRRQQAAAVVAAVGGLGELHAPEFVAAHTLDSVERGEAIVQEAVVGVEQSEDVPAAAHQISEEQCGFGDHVGAELVVVEGVAQLDVLGVVALNEFVGHRDGVGLWVQLLGVGHQGGLGVSTGSMLDAVSSRLEACSSVRLDRSWFPEAISFAAVLIASVASLIDETISIRFDRRIGIVLEDADHALIIRVDFLRQVALRQTGEHGTHIVERLAVGLQQTVDAIGNLPEESAHLSGIEAAAEIPLSSGADDARHLLFDIDLRRPVSPFDSRTQSLAGIIDDRTGNQREAAATDVDFSAMDPLECAQHIALMRRIPVINVETGTEDRIRPEVGQVFAQISLALRIISNTEWLQ